MQTFQNSLGCLLRKCAFQQFTIPNIDIFIEVLRLQNGIKRDVVEPLHVLLYHQRVSMVTRYLVMNTRSGNSTQNLCI